MARIGYLLWLVMAVACGASATYSPAPAAPALPPTSPAAVAVLDLDVAAPDGVTETARSDRYTCNLRIAAPTRVLGTIHIERHEVWTGNEVPREEVVQKARDIAAAHGGNAIAWGCHGIEVLVLPPAAAPPAGQLLAAVAKRAVADGFTEARPPSKLDADALPLPLSPRTCYGVAFALDAGASWGLGGKRGLRFQPTTGLELRDRQADAEPVPADGGEPHVPFARARAGWQFLGCALRAGKAFAELHARSAADAWGKADVLVQLYSRPASGAEVAAAEQAELDRQRKGEERKRIEEACAICAQYRCGKSHCGEYADCLARRGAYEGACERR